MKKTLISIIALAAIGFSTVTFAETYKVAWSHYTGWEPWGWAQDNGIIDKWAKKYGVDIDVVLVNDYIESINLYTSGEFVGCTMTNMDALTIPAVGGVDSTALIIGDYSNGNDAVVLRNGNSIAGLKGREVTLVELSVSHYLLTRALDVNGMSESDVVLVNVKSESDIPALFEVNPNAATVTWNPILMEVRNLNGTTKVFDSANTPGEIIDLMVVRTDTPEGVKKALVGAWYETMAIMSGRGKTAETAIADMASQAGGTVAEFKAQLATTAMFYTPTAATKFAMSGQVSRTMEYVRDFSFNHGLYGNMASSPDFIGITFPDGSTLGSKRNVKLRFDNTLIDAAAAGNL